MSFRFLLRKQNYYFATVKSLSRNDSLGGFSFGAHDFLLLHFLFFTSIEKILISLCLMAQKQLFLLLTSDLDDAVSSELYLILITLLRWASIELANCALKLQLFPWAAITKKP